MVRSHSSRPAGRYLQLGEDKTVGELSRPERRHRRPDDAPAIAENGLIGALVRPILGRRERNHDPGHERHEQQRGKARPDHPACVGIAVDLGQDIADDVADRKEQHARAKLPLADHGKGDDARLARADQVRQQQNRDERGHDVVEIAEMPSCAGDAIDAGEFLVHAPPWVAWFASQASASLWNPGARP